jgi:hypothetical protein
MTTKWKVGLSRFLVVLVIGLAARAAILWLFRHDESRFGDVESLGVLMMIAAFAGLSTGERN